MISSQLDTNAYSTLPTTIPSSLQSNWNASPGSDNSGKKAWAPYLHFRTDKVAEAAVCAPENIQAQYSQRSCNMTDFYGITEGEIIKPLVTLATMTYAPNVT
jgi:hypothetical protein